MAEKRMRYRQLPFDNIETDSLLPFSPQRIGLIGVRVKKGKYFFPEIRNGGLFLHIDEAGHPGTGQILTVTMSGFHPNDVPYYERYIIPVSWIASPGLGANSSFAEFRDRVMSRVIVLSSNISFELEDGSEKNVVFRFSIGRYEWDFVIPRRETEEYLDIP